MHNLLNAFGWALRDTVRPRVLALSLLPLVIMALLTLLLGYFFWHDAVQALRAQLDSYAVLRALTQALAPLGLGDAGLVLAALVLVVLAMPLMALAALLLVSWMMTPAMVALVGKHRFAALERQRGGSWWGSAALAVGATLLAGLVFVLTLPLWLIPPFMLVLPPLIGGWLTSKILAYDALVLHASAAERKQMLRQHRLPLFAMGVASACLSAVPGLLWASSAWLVFAAPVLLPLSIWLYALVFAWSSLCFTHYLLAELALLRQNTSQSRPPITPFHH